MLMGKPKHCVVFGANGFIGSALVRHLLSLGHSVLACDLVREFYALEPVAGLETRSLDFQDEIAVRAAVSGSDWVFHLVSTTKPASSTTNMAFDVQSNVVPSIHLFQACVEEGVKKVVFASSGGTVYGVPQRLPIGEEQSPKPIVSYGLTKLFIERYAELFSRQSDLTVVSLRIGNPYGPRHYYQQQGLIPIFIRRVQQGQMLEVWGDGSVVRDYVHVDDVSKAFVAAAEYDGRCRVFNVGTGQGHSILDILQRLERFAGGKLNVCFRPARGFDVPVVILDVALAHKELGWSPSVGFDDGLASMWQSSL